MPKEAKKTQKPIKEEMFLSEYCNGNNDKHEYARQILLNKYKLGDDPAIINSPGFNAFNSEFCKLYLKSDNTYDVCREKTKRIVILHFLNKTTPAFKYSEKYCGTQEDIPYKILYIAIPCNEEIGISIELLGLGIQDICDDMIIYANVYGGDEIRRIIDFLNIIKTFKNTTLFFISNGGGSIQNTDLVANGISGIKVLNVVSDPRYIGSFKPYKRYEINNINYIYVPPGISTELECNWWFKYYIAKAFSCGKGRLAQFSGTCYLNAVLNGIILSENFSKIFITKMKEMMKNPLYHALITNKEPIPNVCSNLNFLDIIYILKVLYNIFCMGINSKPKTLPLTQTIISQEDKRAQDLLKISSIFFSRNTDPSAKNFGHGGNSKAVLYNIFCKMGLNFVVKITDINLKEYLMIPNCTYTNDILRSFPIDFFNNFLIHLTPCKNQDDKDVILYIGFKRHANMIVFQLPFTVEFCTIQFTVTLKDKSERQHALHEVVGFICDKKYKVYDSSTNMIMDLNWTQLHTQTEYEKARLIFLEHWVDQVDDISDIHISTAVYVNETKMEEYRKTGICNI